MNDPLLGYDAPVVDKGRLQSLTGAQKPPPETSWWEEAGASFRQARQDQAGYDREEETNAYAPIIRELTTRTGRKWTYYVDPNRGTTSAKAVWDDVLAARQRDPKAFADLPANREAFDQQWREGWAQRRAADVATVENGGWTSWLGGSLVGGLTDPVNLGTLSVGGGAARTILQASLREGGVNAAIETLQQPLVAAERAKRGEALTAKEAATNVALGFGVGGAFGGIAHGVGKLRPKTPDGELADAFDSAIPPERQTEAERQAVAELRRDDAIVRDSPFTPGKGSATHVAKMEEATGQLLRGEPPRQRPVSSAEAAARLAANPWEQMKRGIAKAETGGQADPNNAKNPRSSARGRYQIIDGTWTRTMRALGENGTDEALLRLRGNVVWQERVMDRLGADYRAALARVGAPETPGNLYLMHFAGTGGGMRILRADPERAVETILGAKVIEANPFLKGKTAGELVEWAHRKMGAKAPDGPVVARDQFADDVAGDADWSTAQREVEATEAAIRSERAIADAGDDIPFDLNDPRAIARDFEPVGMDWVPSPSPLRATVSAADAADLEARGLGPASLLSFQAKEGTPGITVFRDGSDYATAVYRDADGVARGVVQMPLSPEAREITNEVSSYVTPAFRRQGVATKLYDALASEGLDIDGLSGSADLTPDGAAFVNARRAASRAEMAAVPERATPIELAAADLPAPLADRLTAVDGDVLTFRDHMGGTVQWNPTSEMQRVGKGWRRLGADEFAAAMEQQAREVADDPWLAAIDQLDVLDGEAGQRLDASMAHDVAMLLEEDPDLILQAADEATGTPEVRLADVLRDADDDMAAVEAARACMAPPTIGEAA